MRIACPKFRFHPALYALASAALLIVATGCSMGRPMSGVSTERHTTRAFGGVKVNGGTATHSYEMGQSTLTLSSDFKVPDAPAPHWQVVDSKGNAYLLNRLVTKGEVFHKSVVVPSYVPDIAKVQIWCAFAETLLGEASFASTVR